MSNMDFVTQLIWRYPVLKANEKEIRQMCDAVVKSYESGGKLLVCGNGGSCSDAEHIVGELMKGFLLKRPMTAAQKNAFANALGEEEAEAFASRLQRGLPAISLVSHAGLMTALLNDCDPELVFAQQVYTYMNPCDTLIALSTSGNSANVLNAAITTKAKGGKCVAVTGERDSKISAIADCTIKLPSTETYVIQEYTLPVYHCLCAMLEEEFFGE